MFTEMNGGKVILINTAKDLLKESGTEIFGRFFIALIAQAAQERATLPESKRMPTLVYIDEAADYFDHTIGLILSQARKYKVGMVLAHQYLGQLDPKLQEAFAANTSIKFAGGVSAKDARALAPMMHTTPELIEAQPKLSFAAHIRGVSRQALPLKFPVGHLEDMTRMDSDDWQELRQRMREAYAVHISELADVGVKPKRDWEEAGEDGKAPSPDDQAVDDARIKERREPYKPKAKASDRKPRKAKKPPAKGDISEWKLELRPPKKGRSKDDPDHPDIDPKPDW
jgi:hypothetical protein